MSERALCEVELADSTDGYWDHTGDGYGPAQVVGPVWVHRAVACFQRLEIQKEANEANLEGKAEEKKSLFCGIFLTQSTDI